MEFLATNWDSIMTLLNAVGLLIVGSQAKKLKK